VRLASAEQQRTDAFDEWEVVVRWSEKAAGQTLRRALHVD
jgi:hypothetical protein